MATDFETNLLRHVAASAYALVQLQAARELFGKSYFALGAQEQAAADAAAHTMVVRTYHSILLPAFLGEPAPPAPPSANMPPAGFQRPDPAKGSKS